MVPNNVPLNVWKFFWMNVIEMLDEGHWNHTIHEGRGNMPSQVYCTSRFLENDGPFE